MARSVVVINSILPEVLPCECVKLVPGGSWRKARCGYRDVSFEHLRVSPEHLASRRADDQRASDVCGPIKILRTAIDQIDFVVLKPA